MGQIKMEWPGSEFGSKKYEPFLADRLMRCESALQFIAFDMFVNIYYCSPLYIFLASDLQMRISITRGKVQPSL